MARTERIALSSSVLETEALLIYHVRIKWWIITVLPRVLKVKSLEHHFLCLWSIKWWEWTVMLRLTQIHNLLC